MALFSPSEYSLLSASTQARDDLPGLVERAESRVLNVYSENGTVKLKGFDADPAVCASDLLRALHLEIADVVEHMAQAPDPNVKSATRGERSVTYRDRPSPLPLTFGVYLRPFDEREALYRI